MAPSIEVMKTPHKVDMDQSSFRNQTKLRLCHTTIMRIIFNGPINNPQQHVISSLMNPLFRECMTTSCREDTMQGNRVMP